MAITQLVRLENLDPTTGVVLGCTLTCGTLMMALVGCIRYFLRQKRLVLGKGLSGGWDVIAVWAMLLLIFLVMFVIVLVED